MVLVHFTLEIQVSISRKSLGKATKSITSKRKDVMGRFFLTLNCIQPALVLLPWLQHSRDWITDTILSFVCDLLSRVLLNSSWNIWANSSYLANPISLQNLDLRSIFDLVTKTSTLSVLESHGNRITNIRKYQASLAHQGACQNSSVFLEERKSTISIPRSIKSSKIVIFKLAASLICLFHC